jgi:hypothetical protein
MSETFKLVILYNAKNNAYTVLDHNLSPEEASRLVRDLRSEPLSAFAVNQRVKHEEGDPKACRQCREEVRRASSGLTPRPRFQRRNPE